jgi:hypothetical protein
MRDISLDVQVMLTPWYLLTKWRPEKRELLHFMRLFQYLKFTFINVGAFAPSIVILSPFFSKTFWNLQNITKMKYSKFIYITIDKLKLMRQQWLKCHSDMIGFSTAAKRRYRIVQSSLNVSAGTEVGCRPQSIMGIERLIPRMTSLIDCWLSRSEHLSD